VSKSTVFAFFILVCAILLAGCPPGGDGGTPDTGSTMDAGHSDGGPDAEPEGTWPDVGTPVPGFPDTGLRYGPDGCVYWEEGEAPTTVTEGGTIEGTDGAVEVESGAEVAPLAMCNSHTVVREVIREPERPQLGPPPHPPCSPDNPVECPDETTEARVPPPYRDDAPEPEDPFGYDPPPPIDGECRNGRGWSFEAGDIEGWGGTGAAPKTPVFGNNVSVKRLEPPGFFPAETRVDPFTGEKEYIVEDRVGGDYWEFSRDVNQKGNWWYGTGDERQSHTVAPGGRLSERDVGALTSDPFDIQANFLAFWMGGSSDVAQRVELQIQLENPNEAGLFINSHDGIGDVEFPEDYESLELQPDPDWVVVRSSAPLEDGEYMGRRVVWDIQQFNGRTARIRVVDEERSDPTDTVCPMPSFCTEVDRMAHINVDDFRCLDEVPEGVEFKRAFNEPGTPITGVGDIVEPQPIWGYTESHSHATANLSFGGHMIWGDPSDDLKDVYNCLGDLPEIPELGSGDVLRPAINNPRRVNSCFLRMEMIALITSTALGACVAASAPLHAIPLFGSLAAAAEIAACTAGVGAIAGVLLATPLLSNHYYHGAQMPTSGALEAGPMLRFIVEDLVGQYTEEIESGMLHIPGMIEDKDFDLPDGTHSGQGLGQFHQRYQKDMIRRAYEGGLRLMVIDVHNSRAMQGVLDGRTDYDDWTATWDHIRSVEHLVAPPGDPTWGAGPLHDIAEIALSPTEARDIIGRGKMAIILGAEVMEYGKLRDETDSMEQQVADLYARGVRKITAIHGTNNPLGGSGLFQDVYQSANIFNNLTLDGDYEDVSRWDSLLPVKPIALPGTFPFPFAGMELGSWGIAESLVAPPCDGEACEWNIRNKAHFEVVNDPGPNDVIGGVEDVTFRLGYPSTRAMKRVESAEAVEPKYLNVHRSLGLGWLLGVGPGGGPPVPQCSLDGMYVPLDGPPPDDILEQYEAVEGQHFNARGLTDRGADFLQEMMKRGMLLDTDHFGQRTRNDTRDLTEAFASDAGLGDDSDYPVFGVHTEVRGFGHTGPYPDLNNLVLAGGWESEISKPESEIEHIGETGGTVTVSVAPYVNDAPLASVGGVPALVENNCDFSSKSWSHKYLKMVELMGGYGVTPGFDMNGFAPGIAPRYGLGTACRSGITHHALDGGGYERSEVIDESAWSNLPHLASWPRDWVYDAEHTLDPEDRCRYNGSLRGDWQEHCPSTKMVHGQLEEFSGVIYDDYDDYVDFDPSRVRSTEDIDWFTGSDPNLSAVLARSADELRDDGAVRYAQDEWVYIGGGGEFAQRRPMVKWTNDGAAVTASRNTGWDINLDGFLHVGLMPDLFQDMRNTGVTWEMMTPMFNSAEDYIRMWETNCEIARAWHDAQGMDSSGICAEGT
jgi:microsomal dipeptidase-like Zn-dependent dipeptidase